MTGDKHLIYNIQFMILRPFHSILTNSGNGYVENKKIDWCRTNSHTNKNNVKLPQTLFSVMRLVLRSQTKLCASHISIVLVISAGCNHDKIQRTMHFSITESAEPLQHDLNS